MPGQIEIKHLQWEKDRILVKLLSTPGQIIMLETPSGMNNFAVKQGDAVLQEGSTKNSRKLTLPANREVTLEISSH